jgi:hypothetical protein
VVLLLHRPDAFERNHPQAGEAEEPSSASIEEDQQKPLP